MSDATTFRLGFLAALRWMYRDTAEYVRGEKEFTAEDRKRMDAGFLSDLAWMRKAYRAAQAAGRQRA